MQIWTLTHPEHGRMVVTDIRDVERNIGFGWKLDEPKADEQPAQEQEVITEQPKRRGRPPKVSNDDSAAGN